jgi:hypothetical protein
VYDACIVVKMHREGERLEPDEGSEDSDYESGSEQANGVIPESLDDIKEGAEAESLPVLTMGTSARCVYRRFQALAFYLSDSWRSLFFYLCTGDIQFAPLKSQGVDLRRRYVKEKTTDGLPAPCSPKGIYSLARAVGI